MEKNVVWNLSRMFKNEEEFNNSIIEVENLLIKVKTYKGKILENLFDVLELSSHIDKMTEKIYVYAHLKYYDNMIDNKNQEDAEKSLNIYDKVKVEESFITPELLSNDYEKVLEIIKNNSKFKKYEFTLEKIFRYKPHTLSTKEEKLLSNMSEVMRTSKQAYMELNNSDIIFNKIQDENKKTVVLTSSNYIKFLSSKDKKVRRSAFNSMYKFYKDHINTISSLYIGNIKNNSFVCKTRKYDSILQMYLFDDKINTSLYKKLIKVTDNNIKYLQEYYKLKAEVLGVKKLHMYDTYLNISSLDEKEIKYQQAIDITINALSILGNTYIEDFKCLLNSGCVDVYPKKAKRSGAYQWGSYRVLPYVSLNYENNVDSLSTFAHEMGHAMHTYYSDLNQNFLDAGYSIFLAEIASTVNEILLSNYLIKNTKNINEKIYYTVDFLDKFKATVYRQTMFAEFENIIYEKHEKKEAITKDLLCDEYYKLNIKHFSPVLIVDENIKYEWAKIPHFYTPFYVYKYATGFISALVIADKLEKEKEFKNKYLEFLKSGGKSYPLNLLNTLGIDITDEKVLNKSFDLFNEKIQELKKYLNEEGE